MSIRGTVRRLFQRAEVAVSGRPEGLAARTMQPMFEILGKVKGYETSFDPQRETYRRFEVERGRFAAYRDAWVAAEESPVAGMAILSLAEDCTGEPFTVKCSDRRAAEEIDGLFKRIGYWGPKRQGTLARLCLTGDHFSFLDLNRSPQRRRNLAEITGFRMAPEFTMFRLSDARGQFPNWKRAFMQVAAIELVTRRSGEAILQSESGNRLIGGPAHYEGLAGVLSGREFVARDGKREFFSAEEVIHARLRPWWQPTPTGYGVGSLRNGSRLHNIIMGVTQDLAIARQFSSFNQRAFECPGDTTNEVFEKLCKQLEEMKVGPGTFFPLRGAVAKSLDARNWQLSDLADVWFHIDMLGFLIGYPLALAGFGADRFTGEILERMEQRFKRVIAFWNQLEEWEIVRPLIDRTLWYIGKGDVDYEVEFPPVSFEDENKKTKRELSKSEGGAQSRKKTAMTLNKITAEEWEEEFRQIEKELKTLGPITKYKAPGESLVKGKKGVQKKDAAVQDIGDAEGTD